MTGLGEAWKPSGNSTETQLDSIDSISSISYISQTLLPIGNWMSVSGTGVDSAGSNTLTDNATVISKMAILIWRVSLRVQIVNI